MPDPTPTPGPQPPSAVNAQIVDAVDKSTNYALGFAPLVFLGGFGPALAGMALWGVGMGAQESIMRAALATMVPPDRRGSAYGVFNAGYGVSWFLGSALMGLLYDASPTALVAFSVAVQLAAVPAFWSVARQGRQTPAS